MDERKKLDERIARLEEELAEAYRLNFPWSGNLGRWEWHYPTGKVICSPLKLEALGFQAGEINPMVYEWTERIHPEDFDRTMSLMRRHLMGDLPVYEVEYRIRAKDGSYKWFYDRGKVTEFSPEGKPLVIAGIVFDITESKQMEENLKKSVDFKTRLFAIISHDLRGPIGAAGHLLEALKDMDPSDYPAAFEALTQSNHRTFDLLENLLEWGKVNIEKPRVNRQPLRLMTPIARQIALLKPQAEKKSITLIQTFDESLFVSADEIMLEVIIRNLLSNAIKFTPANGHIEVYQTTDSDRVSLHIHDSGVGMSPSVLQSLQTKAVRSSLKGTEGESGTGLGLLLCQEFAQLIHGELLIESELGKGSTFTIRLEKP